MYTDPVAKLTVTSFAVPSVEVNRCEHQRQSTLSSRRSVNLSPHKHPDTVALVYTGLLVFRLVTRT